MPIISEFKYHKPRSLKEACGLLDLYKSNAKVLAGGTDLILRLKEEIEKPEILVDIKGLKELSEIKFSKEILKIGALATFGELIESTLVKNKFPLIWETSRSVASAGVRNRATMAGNICSAVPSADSAPALLVYDAVVIAESVEGERKISILDWFLGPRKNALKGNEMATAIEVPLPKGRHGAAYLKLSRYSGEDLAQAGIAVMAFSGKTFRIAHCALGPRPERAEKTETYLGGGALPESVLNKAADIFSKEISPISDIRSSGKYRTHMAKVMLKRALTKARARMKGKEKYEDFSAIV